MLKWGANFDVAILNPWLQKRIKERIEREREREERERAQGNRTLNEVERKRRKESEGV